MKAYEGVFIFPAEATPDVRKGHEKSLEDVIKKFKGTIKNKVEWGRRPLGHALRKSRDGFIYVLDFELDPIHMNELRKGLELQESLLKYMVTIKDERLVRQAAVAAALPTPTTKHWKS